MAWPPLTWQTHTWHHRDRFASRRSQQRNVGDFQVAIVPEITSSSPEITQKTAELASNTTAKMTRFDQEFAHLAGFPFATVLLRGESATSSQIENLTVNARKLSLASLGANVGGNAEMVARNVTAMKAAIDLAQNIDASAILRMHHELTHGVQHDAGEFRQEWVWIGGESPVTAQYVGPHWNSVPPLINDLTQFMLRRDVDPTVQAAVAHAQFETIHPFTDGNGRTGRALVSSLLRSRGVTNNLTIPISSGLLHDIDGYIGALSAYRAGDIEPIIECFAVAVDAALENARILARDIEVEHARMLSSRTRVTSSFRKVAKFCCSEPAFTAAMLEAHAGVSKSTAYRIVDSLVDAGILREEKKVHGQKAWSSPAILKALDDFAQRAGRRKFS